LINYVKLIKIEEIAPFPSILIEKEIKVVLSNKNKKVDIVWIQEEPMNQGAF
jgi:2-oxoglutarate dehydrogenase complex dehydrogenase (E1) component-like enzyme